MRISPTTTRRLLRRPRLLAVVLPLILFAGAAIVVYAWRLPGSDRLEDLVHSGDAAGFNLLLVTLDTTRQDALGCYGYVRAETPAIDGLAGCGVRFDDAVTSAPLTLPSHATILTGRYPPNHGARMNGTHRLSPEHETLTETLKGHGYDTAAFLASFILDRRFGLAQGFDVYDSEVAPEGFDHGCLECNERRADAVTDAAIAWLSQRRQGGTTAPFFAWVHYFDPHTPFDSPLGQLTRFAGRPYDAEIAFMDQHLQRLLDELDRQQLHDRTLIAVASDHGEALGEHGEPNHGMLIYGCTTRVALILSCPALFDRAYCVWDRVVGLVDLRPTLEDLLGIVPLSPSDGISLLAPGAADPERAIYLETLVPLYTAGWSPLHGLRRHHDKYILAPQPEYYDLRSDPRETSNLYASNPGPVAALERQLADLLADWAAVGDGDAGSTRSMSSAEIERLAALGYAGGGAPLLSEDPPDPKVMMPLYAKAVEAQRLLSRGDFLEAKSLAEEVVAQCDNFTTAHQVLARIYLRLGRVEDAADVYRKSLRHNPSFYIVKSLVRVLLILEEYDEIDVLLAQAESLDPGSGEVAVLWGDYMAKRGRRDDALRWYRHAIEIDESRVGVPAREKIAQLDTP